MKQIEHSKKRAEEFNLENENVTREYETIYREESEGFVFLNAVEADFRTMDEFLKNRLRFISIPKVIEKVLDKHRNVIDPGLDDILEADRWARREAYNFIQKLG